MLTKTYSYSLQEVSLPPQADLEASVFFDIETTGFRAASSHLYMIGAAVHCSSGWRITQWMAEKPSEEAGLLRVFSAFLRPFRILLHFNGERFDIPYLTEKYSLYQIEEPFSSMQSIDLYRDFRPLKKLLCLDHINQRSLEQFLHISRDDRFDGGQLINVCRGYWKNHDPELLSLLLLHNRDDLSGMLDLTALYRYLPLTGAGFRECTDKMELSARILPGSPGRLCIEIHLKDPLPAAFRHECDLFSLSGGQDGVRLLIPVFSGKMKVFFSNPKDYYYLPLEDQAIHKSVGCYVDPACRQKATADTCYIPKESIFLPQPPDGGFTPVYREQRKSPVCYFELPEQIDDPVFLSQYVGMLLQRF